MDQWHKRVTANVTAVGSIPARYVKFQHPTFNATKIQRKLECINTGFPLPTLLYAG